MFTLGPSNIPQLYQHIFSPSRKFPVVIQLNDNSSQLHVKFLRRMNLSPTIHKLAHQAYLGFVITELNLVRCDALI